MKHIINPYVLNKTPNYYKKIAPFIVGEKILDIGCGNGRLKSITDKNIIGIDIVKERTEHCKKIGYENTYCLDINKDELPFSSHFFSTIVCLDVLEHLYDPLGVLFKLNKVLEKNGRLIVSCPNIGFIVSRLLHLFGIFSDLEIPHRIINSHIRFFTIRKLKKVVEMSGFKTIKVMGVIPHDSVAVKPLQLLAKAIPSLFGYTIVLIAEKEKEIQPNNQPIQSSSIFKHLFKIIT